MLPGSRGGMPQAACCSNNRVERPIAFGAAQT